MDLLKTFILVLLLCTSSYTDLRYRKIRNVHTIPAAALGLLLNTLESGLSGFSYSVLGLAFGFCLLFIPLVLGGLGAGDVKLLAAIGAINGWNFVLLTFVHAAIIGGVIAIIYSFFKRGIKKSLQIFVSFTVSPIIRVLYHITKIQSFGSIYIKLSKNMLKVEKLYIPYAIPIALGVMFILL